MKFLIVNQHSMNYGDDIAGIALIQGIKSRFGDNVDIDIIYNTHGKLDYSDKKIKHQLDITLKNIGYIQLFLFLLLSIFKIELVYNSKLKEFKSIVKSSNVIFVSPCGANIGIYKDWRFLVKLLLVIKFGGKPIFHNNTIGKSNSILFNMISNYVLKKSVLYVRELASYEYLKEKKLNSIRAVDTGFLFENKKKTNIEEEKYTVFIPTSIDSWHPNFKGIDVNSLIQRKVLKEYVEFVKKNDIKLVILPHLYGQMDEEKLLYFYKSKFIELGMKEENITIPIISDCFDYDNYIKYSKFVLSMRYHGVIMSIKNMVPFISLAYENKMKEACDYSGLKFLNINIKDLDIIERIDFIDVMQNEENIKSIMEERVPYLEFMAAQCLNQIQFIFNRRKNG